MATSVRVVPSLSLRPGFSSSALSKVWRFSLHMNLISCFALLFVQTDRLMISRLLPIAELGFYSVAYTVAGGLSIIQSVVSTALFPALAQQVRLAEPADIQKRCGIATQVLMYVVCGIGSVLIFYGRDLLTVWISSDTAMRSAVSMVVLSSGFMLSAAVSVPFTLAIAAGQTTLPLAANGAAALVYLPVLYWLVRNWGIDGAAWAWGILNAYYLLVLLPLLQRRIPMEPVHRWFLRHVFPFASSGLLVVGGSQIAVRYLWGEGPRQSIAGLVVGGLAYASLAFTFLDANVVDRFRTWRRGYTGLQKVPTA